MRSRFTVPGTGRHSRALTAVVLAVLGLLAAAGLTPTAYGASIGARPLVVSISAAPLVVPARGGMVRVTAQVRNAQRCTVRGQRSPFSSLSQVHTVSCRSGRVSVRMRLAANSTSKPVAIHYLVRAVGAGGHAAQKSATVLEAAAGGPSDPGDQAPLEIGTLDLPAATAGAPYSATLVASGGKPPYRWSIASGALPDGLTLAATGAISGTPATPGQATLTIQVADSSTPARTATAAASVVVAPPATPPAPGSGVASATSRNWSGYVLDGGPFTAVQGTFNVPALTRTSTASSVGEWVGIDGDTSSNPTVLQAGVGEDYNPATNRFSVYAWWESYPAPPELVPVIVNPGDQVTVKIDEVSTGLWLISIRDDTSGLSYSTRQSYSGATTSAEWIVEAPQSAQTGDILQLAHYTGNVTFTNLGVSGAETTLTRIVMVQDGAPVSEPSDLTPAGFTVAYGTVVPAPPG